MAKPGAKILTANLRGETLMGVAGILDPKVTVVGVALLGSLWRDNRGVWIFWERVF